jgi:cytidylate kinase
MVDDDCIREVTEQILKEVVEAGTSVIVGRGSAYYLGRRRDAFHVFIYAPFEDKVRRLRALGKSEKEAADLAETVDTDRAAFIKKYFNVEWPERHRFHLMINSSVGDEVAVETVIDTHARFEKQRA